MTRFHVLSLLLVPVLVLALSQDAQARRCGRRGGCGTTACGAGGCATGNCATGNCNTAAVTAAPTAGADGQVNAPPAPAGSQAAKTKAAAPARAGQPAVKAVPKQAPNATQVRPARTTKVVE